MRLTGNTILITGATSGIGRGLAERFHDRGNQVIIAGRRQALLDEITAAHPGMRAIPLDVQSPAAIDAAAVRVRKEFPALNVLINNAGISKAEDLTDGAADLSVARSIIDANILGVLHLTAALLPLLRTQKSSTVITTTSGLAFLPVAAYPTYCATKAFLHSWLQSLRAQLRHTPVEVLELLPPYVQTELTGAAQLTDPRAVPLDDYVNEVMQVLEANHLPRGEILVEAVRELRFAEAEGAYDALFASRNLR